jgi:AbrB family looped-hinge helix DNA binding protein
MLFQLVRSCRYALAVGTEVSRERPLLWGNFECRRDVNYARCKAMTEVIISATNRIVIPRDAREALGLKPGDKVLVIVRGCNLLIMRKPKSYHAAIRGLGRGLYPKSYLQRERRSWD